MAEAGDPHPAAPAGAEPAHAPGDPPERELPRERSELEIRWRQARNPPPPVLRAVLTNIAVATVGGVLLIAYDWLAARGVLPGGDQRTLAVVLYGALVLILGSVLTWRWVELPTGSGTGKARSPWAGVLGFFASVPILYLALVIIFQVLRPALG